MVTTARDREAFDQAIVRGSELLKQGKLGDAIASFRTALEIEPDNQKVLALLGLTHFRANELDAARPIYEDLAEMAPTDASHRLNLGLVYLKLNDSERAINALEASRSLDPSQGRAVSYLGLAYARAGRYVEAYRSFLLAGQNELATEIEVNLTLAERDGILAQLGRPPGGPIAKVPATKEPVVARTRSEPRTKPPNAPPGRSRSDNPTDAASAATAASSTVQLGARTELPHDAVDGGRSPPDREMSSIGISMTGSGSISLGAAEALVPAQAPQELSSAEISIVPMTDSQQFVLPAPAAAPPAETPAGGVPVIGASRVSMAVAAASPSATTATRTAAGGFAARALSELATEDLIRPDDGDDALEIAPNGALLVRVTDRVITRLDGVHVTGGDLAFERATRRSRGHQTEEQFDTFHNVAGKGYLIAAPPKDQRFSAVTLDDDILYVREDLVFAFEATLRWENGNVPGLRGKLHVVQFRGDGALAVRLARPLIRVKLPPSGLVFVDPDRLAGWIGRVIPRAVVSPDGGPLGSTCVECTGEGIVLVEPAPAERAAVARAVDEAAALDRPKPPTPAPLPPPEPPQPSEIAPEVADFAADLAAFNKAADAAEGTKPPASDDESF